LPGRRIFTLSTFVAQYKHEVVSASIGHPTSPSQTRFRDPGHPQPPEPGSRAAGSSSRRTGRDVACSGSIVVGRTNRVLITTFVLWAEAKSNLLSTRPLDGTRNLLGTGHAVNLRMKAGCITV
jgi:hypothetical protein